MSVYIHPTAIIEEGVRSERALPSGIAFMSAAPRALETSALSVERVISPMMCVLATGSRSTPSSTFVLASPLKME
jgi:hypothetical protein